MMRRVDVPSNWIDIDRNADRPRSLVDAFDILISSKSLMKDYDQSLNVFSRLRILIGQGRIPL